jgi:hypothetical protein
MKLNPSVSRRQRFAQRGVDGEEPAGKLVSLGAGRSVRPDCLSLRDRGGEKESGVQAFGSLFGVRETCGDSRNLPRTLQGISRMGDGSGLGPKRRPNPRGGRTSKSRFTRNRRSDRFRPFVSPDFARRRDTASGRRAGSRLGGSGILIRKTAIWLPANTDGSPSPPL